MLTLKSRMSSPEDIAISSIKHVIQIHIEDPVFFWIRTTRQIMKWKKNQPWMTVRPNNGFFRIYDFLKGIVSFWNFCLFINITWKSVFLSDIAMWIIRLSYRIILQTFNRFTDTLWHHKENVLWRGHSVITRQKILTTYEY
jgi:hypothetical protein